jgi:hypothetical protein
MKAEVYAELEAHAPNVLAALDDIFAGALARYKQRDPAPRQTPRPRLRAAEKRRAGDFVPERPVVQLAAGPRRHQGVERLQPRRPPGQRRLQAIGGSPDLFTLAPHTFGWFRLEHR